MRRYFYSPPVSKSKFSTIDIGATKERLRAINYNLRHYIKLSRFMPFSLQIKHDFTNNEADSILAHIVKSNAKLVVIGAKNLSVGSLFNKDMLPEKLRGAHARTPTFLTF